ncbi:MAG: hypothetical protein H6Q36_1645, partial [Chloroflexi bacterium]|nr:hypothetical protein [Chloroflexota bacterium]
MLAERAGLDAAVSSTRRDAMAVGHSRHRRPEEPLDGAIAAGGLGPDRPDFRGIRRAVDRREEGELRTLRRLLILLVVVVVMAVGTIGLLAVITG